MFKQKDVSFLSFHHIIQEGQVLSGGTQQLIENAFYGMYHYIIKIKLGFNW